MLSDDDIQRVAIQCDMKIGQHWNKGRMNTRGMRAFARAVEREARNHVLEEVAKLCERVADEYQELDEGKWPEMRAEAATGARACANAIQAIKERQC